MEYTKFSNAEWDKIQQAAKTKWETAILGKRPDFKTVAADLPNRFAVTPLEWVAMLVLLVLTIYTSYKVGALAIPFAERLIGDLSGHTYISPLVGSSFKLVTAVLFMLLATPSLIYFKLLDKDPEVMKQKKETAHRGWLRRLSLDYITPRLPYMITYLSALWLIYVSTYGGGSPFERFLPVIVEIGLAQLVGTIMQKRADYRNLVWSALADRVPSYETRKRNYELDPDYLKILYQTMRDAIIRVQRQGKFPNRELETIDGKVMDRILMDEYRRLTGGLYFANQVTRGSEEVDYPQIPDPVIYTNGKRKPPHGDNKWTPETLVFDLRKRGVGTDYSEKQLSVDYAAGYGARSAWRNGAKEALARN